jgi:phosphatidylinositol alpha-1,6-mannosyltransferase
LYVGRLIRRKGLDDIIKAVSIVAKTKLIQLDVIGGGNDGRIAEFKKISEDLKITSNVNFIGEIKDLKEIAKYYAGCNVLIMAPKVVYPSGGFESFGCVFLEAGLFKKPVIGTEHFGVKEAVVDGKSGILVKENNPIELSRAILKLINNKDLSIKMGEYNYKRTINKFMDTNSTEQLSIAMN